MSFSFADIRNPSIKTSYDSPQASVLLISMTQLLKHVENWTMLKNITIVHFQVLDYIHCPGKLILNDLA